jgi:hypothetical protein
MSESLPVEIGSDERVFFTGHTGTGKTYLARGLTDSLDRLVVLDPKNRLQNWRLDKWDRESERLLRIGDPVRTRIPGPQTPDYWEDVLAQAYRAGNLTVYIDEVYLLSEEGKGFPRTLSTLYTCGRELGIGTWASAQRPAWVPRVLLSESEHVFAFFLLLEDDRQAMARNLHPDLAAEIPSQDEHGFRYWNIRERKPVYYPQYDLGPGAGWGDLGSLVDEETELEEEEA